MSCAQFAVVEKESQGIFANSVDIPWEWWQYLNHSHKRGSITMNLFEQQAKLIAETQRKLRDTEFKRVPDFRDSTDPRFDSGDNEDNRKPLRDSMYKDHLFTRDHDGF